MMMRAEWTELVEKELVSRDHERMTPLDIAMLQQTGHPPNIQRAQGGRQVVATGEAVDAVIQFRRAVMQGKIASTPTSRKRNVSVDSEAGMARAEALSVLYAKSFDKDTRFQSFQDDIERVGRPSPPRLEQWLRDRYEKELPVEWEWPMEVVLNTVVTIHFMELAYPAKGGVRWHEVATRGLLGDLAVWCAYISEWFRWDPADTTRWLVCGGKLPVVQAVTVEYQVGATGPMNSTTRMLMWVDPTLSGPEVAAAYMEARRPLVDEERERVRSMDVKAARLAQFALEQPEDINDATWERWIRKWNASRQVKANPSWRCGERKTDKDNFVRAVRDACERLSRTEWRDPSESRTGQRRVNGIHIRTSGN
jgi:hypothetical protein